MRYCLPAAALEVPAAGPHNHKKSRKTNRLTMLSRLLLLPGARRHRFSARLPARWARSRIASALAAAALAALITWAAPRPRRPTPTIHWSP